MLTFKSLSDLEQLPQDYPVYSPIKLLLQQIIKSNTESSRSYNPEDDGYIVLIEQGDIDRVLDELGHTSKWVDLRWEGVTLMDGFFHAVYVPNNQFALSFLIPDESWITGELRQSLVAHLDD